MAKLRGLLIALAFGLAGNVSASASSLTVDAVRGRPAQLVWSLFDTATVPVGSGSVPVSTARTPHAGSNA